ncbi:MAG: hypothetical protein IPK19_21095 [Chloroflexi bacterium]|nr:hypothetical protein [Chloroflexota bacterium]
MSQYRNSQQKKRGGLRPLLPVFGLIVAIVFGVVGWLVAPSVITALADAIPGFRGNEIDATLLRAIVTVVIALLALVVFSLIAALVTPKPGMSAREADLAREKEAMRAAQQAARDRQRRSGRR